MRNKSRFLRINDNWIEIKTVRKIKNENRELRDRLSKHLEKIFWWIHLWNEMKISKTTDIRSDAILFDDVLNRFIVIEYKITEDKWVIEQVRSYIIAINEDRFFILKKLNKKTWKDYKEDDINWNLTKSLIITSDRFEKHQMNSIKKDLVFDIELYSFRDYGWWEIVLRKFYPVEWDFFNCSLWEPINKKITRSVRWKKEDEVIFRNKLNKELLSLEWMLISKLRTQYWTVKETFLMNNRKRIAIENHKNILWIHFGRDVLRTWFKWDLMRLWFMNSSTEWNQTRIDIYNKEWVLELINNLKYIKIWNWKFVYHQNEELEG